MDRRVVASSSIVTPSSVSVNSGATSAIELVSTESEPLKAGPKWDGNVTVIQSRPSLSPRFWVICGPAISLTDQLPAMKWTAISSPSAKSPRTR